jgi:hypothetical protein
MSGSPNIFWPADPDSRVPWQLSATSPSLNDHGNTGIAEFCPTPRDVSNSEQDTFRAFLARELKRVKAVTRVEISEHGAGDRTIVRVLTFLSLDDAETRYQVYGIEERLMHRFQDELFDFRLQLDA